ncbi:hypothetical protein VSR69_37505 [Paraburkholderia phytofirmans]|uniref:hypothetical protein n=1 Tax=Paraburkholderia sp. BL9I2N2 TaxID=1938809 RepID=UPI00104D783B|nr:hypothetical protein [Paraburkholderia sp. BL9I2N2]
MIAHVIEDAGEAHAVAAQFEGRVLFQDGPVGKDAERNVKVYAAIRKPFITLALMGMGFVRDGSQMPELSRVAVVSISPNAMT